MQEQETEVEADKHDPMNTADTPPGMQEVKAAAAEGRRELVDDTDLGA